MTLITPYKNRILDKFKPIRVYRNLTLKGVWYSLRQNGKTVAHASSLCLIGCTFHVSQKGRERVIKNNRKAFHAYAEGYYCGIVHGNLPAHIKYDPYKNKEFMHGSRHVKSAAIVVFNENGVSADFLNKIL